VVAFKVLLLKSYVPMAAPILLFKTIFGMVLWNSVQSCHSITPDVNVIEMSSCQYFLIFGNRKKNSLGARSGE
jgi:hypothetical protein